MWIEIEYLEDNRVDGLRFFVATRTDETLRTTIERQIFLLFSDSWHKCSNVDGCDRKVWLVFDITGAIYSSCRECAIEASDDSDTPSILRQIIAACLEREKIVANTERGRLRSANNVENR